METHGKRQDTLPWQTLDFGIGKKGSEEEIRYLIQLFEKHEGKNLKFRFVKTPNKITNIYIFLVLLILFLLCFVTGKHLTQPSQ